ncbi:MAG: peptidoglycan DD-metalloendopeptidase family protein [Rhodospirillaceae bacterium]
MSRSDRTHIAGIAAVLLATISVQGIAGADTARADDGIRSRLDAVERDLGRNRVERETLSEAAGRAEAELRDIRLQGIALAREMHRRDEQITQIEGQIDALEADERTKAGDMHRRRAELAATLAALQRIARMPASTLLVVPRPPDDTIRSAILLRAAVPELHREARKLGREVEALAAVRERIGEERRLLGDAIAALEEERRKLAAATVQKAALLDATRTAERKAAQEVASLSARAGSMRELMENLARQKARQNRTPALRGPDFEPPPEPVGQTQPPETGGTAVPPEIAPRKTVSRPANMPPSTPAGPLPAPGRIDVAFGDVMPNGVTSRGVSIVTRPSSAVVAPKAGRVVFAGHFRGYGNLVILELDDKGHALISGMSTISATVGDEVLAGEPLGEMTPSTDAAPKLYFELRRRGQPVNPLPPEAAHRNKVSG